MEPMRRRLWIAGAFIGLLAALLPASAASAHATLDRTSPAAGSVVQTAPTEVTLTFNESVQAVVDKIRVTGPDGKRADTGNASIQDHDLRIPLRTGGPQGTYLVSYRVISADSHPISGGFSYSVGQVTATPTDSGSGPVSTDPVVSTALAAARYLGFAGLVLLIGPALVLFALWPRRLSPAGPARVALGAVLLLTVSTLLELYLQIPYTAGTGVFSASGTAVRDVFDTPFAAAHLVRLGVLASVTVLLRPLISGRAGKVDQTLLVILAVVGLATWPISGHPSSSPVPTLTVVADVAHLAAMSVWLGGLVMLFAFILPKANDRELSAILPVWSGWAMFAVTVLVLAGTAQALVEIGTLSALTGTTYGKIVLIKVGLLAVVLCIAAASRQVVNRSFAAVAVARVDEDASGGEDADASGGELRDASGGELRDASRGELTDADDLDRLVAMDEADVDEADVDDIDDVDDVDRSVAKRRLRRAVIAEVAIAAVVLGFTAALVQTSPARSAQAAANAPAEPFSVTLTDKLFKLEVDVAPAGTGANTIHLYAFAPDGTGAQTVAEWKGTAALPSQNIGPIDIPLLAITPDHASGQITLPTPGTWQMKFTVRTDDTHQATVTANVPIK
jgi:copper transport protein